MHRSARPEPGSDEDRSPAGFRLRHGRMSKSTYHRNKNKGRCPRETVLSARTITITKKDEDAERGRCFAFIAPLDMPLRIGTALNPKALKLAEAAFSRKLLI